MSEVKDEVVPKVEKNGSGSACLAGPSYEQRMQRAQLALNKVFKHNKYKSDLQQKAVHQMIKGCRINVNLIRTNMSLLLAHGIVAAESVMLFLM